MIKVLVSGTYDILHAGHIQFFEEARKQGDYLIVNFCSDANLVLYKGRHGCMPDDNKKILLEALRCVDKAYQGTNDGGIFDFVETFYLEKPDILAVTVDDRHVEAKRVFCEKNGAKLVVLPKDNSATRTTTFEIIKKIWQQEKPQGI